MTRTETAISMVLIAVLAVILFGVYSEVASSREELQRSSADERALWTLERIVGAMEVYYTDNHAFPYDPQGADQALQRIYAEPAPGTQGPMSPARVEYLNPTPDFDPLGPPVVLLVAGSASSQDGLVFFFSSDGCIFQCQEKRVRDLGIKTLAGLPIQGTLPRYTTLIEDLNVPWFFGS